MPESDASAQVNAEAAAGVETPSAAPATDPLRSVADAVSTALQAARDGAQDASAAARDSLPEVGAFLSRLTYTTFYAVSYGVVFASLMVAGAVPKENALVHGLVDGARAARDAVAHRGTKEAEGTADAAAAPQPA